MNSSEKDARRTTHDEEIVVDFWGWCPDEYVDFDVENIRATDARVVGESGDEQIAVSIEIETQ